MGRLYIPGLIVNPCPALQRTCTKDYPVPGTNFTIPKGMMVNVPPPAGCFKEQDKLDSWMVGKSEG